MSYQPHIKCIVKGCNNHRDEGFFRGAMCGPCYHMITTGEIGPTDSFLGDMQRKLDAVEKAKHQPGPPMTEEELRALRPGDVVAHRRDGQQFQVLGNFGGRVTAVDLADITNPNEWEVVVRRVSDRELDSVIRPHLYTSFPPKP